MFKEEENTDSKQRVCLEEVWARVKPNLATPEERGRVKNGFFLVWVHLGKDEWGIKETQSQVGVKTIRRRRLKSSEPTEPIGCRSSWEKKNNRAVVKEGWFANRIDLGETLPQKSKPGQGDKLRCFRTG